MDIEQSHFSQRRSNPDELRRPHPMLAGQADRQWLQRPAADHPHPGHTGARIEELERILARQLALAGSGNRWVKLLQCHDIGLSRANRRDHRPSLIITAVEIVGHHRHRRFTELQIIAKARHPHIEQYRRSQHEQGHTERHAQLAPPPAIAEQRARRQPAHKEEQIEGEGNDQEDRPAQTEMGRV